MSQFCYEWPRPAVTVDIVVFAIDWSGQWHTLLVKRGRDPYSGSWALPGGFLEMGETSVSGALRELEEETGFKTTKVPILLGVYDDVGRDPRGRTLSIAYMTVVPNLEWGVEGRDDAAEAKWHPLTGLPSSLAFDHDEILTSALEKLAVNLRVPFKWIITQPRLNP